MPTHVTAIIRNRGQLTIPDPLRQNVSWLEPNSVVSITTLPLGGIVIKPYVHDMDKKATNWTKVWNDIKIARSFRGKKGNLSAFTVNDREEH
ncbi:MAG: hypothetical protein UT63_C0036G0008 [Candidatus Gottesmanbacteria bacterium GW2011_GWC2_39_8]|uniref:Uncharacterized protein n=1 Tax=Candidatus Gottesmanbacteria bacterium GW2011_GWC2_39_8 TaxID=1618450 RepID=A0A0G0PWY5_9BACT|nr:MAG: hypothetical protein UT63_C0036G0008 [Candidatus Gottesmanbacteria bacterium GW2011_GWC2_39_8]